MDIKAILSNLHFEQLSEMQRNAIELIRNNANAVILAPTGTGKTLAFLIPLTESIDTTTDTLQAVILSPTRELAIQTFNVLQQMKTPLLFAPLLRGSSRRRWIVGLLWCIAVGREFRVCLFGRNGKVLSASN